MLKGALFRLYTAASPIMPYTYEYPRPALTVDCVVFGLDGDVLKVLLIERDREPFAGCWALPGGFVDMDETPEHAAARELEEETGLAGVAMEELGVFGRPDRDPRGRVVAVAHLALVRVAECLPRAADDARNVAWHPARRPPRLAFDHDEILAAALRRLERKARREAFARPLLPPRFTMADLQRVYEQVLGRRLDPRRFRTAMRRSGVLAEAAFVVPPSGGKRKKGRLKAELRTGAGSARGRRGVSAPLRFDARKYKQAQGYGLFLPDLGE